MDTSNFTGRAGFYAKFDARRSGGPVRVLLGGLISSSELTQDLHVTLMWSRFAPCRKALSELRSVFSSPVEAHISKLAWIPGYDKQGYLVAEIDSIDVHDRHDLLTKVGCTPRWATFYPHMTLMKSVTKAQVQYLVDRGNVKLRLNRCKIDLTGVVCSDWR